VKAIQLIPTPLQQLSESDRAARKGPPVQMVVMLAGSINTVSLAVNLVA
jgi:hypothetical protein